MNKKLSLFLIFNFSFLIFVAAQPDRWQQRVKYTMNVDVDVNSNRFNGVQKLEYTNNSPDKLDKGIFSFILECLSARQRNGCKKPGIG